MGSIDTRSNDTSPPPAEFLNIFRRREIAAEVPAIQLTREEWAQICTIIKELGDLYDDLCPAAIENTLIEGKAISRAAYTAWGLKHWLRM